MSPEIEKENNVTITLLGELGSAAKGSLGQELTDEEARLFTEDSLRLLVMPTETDPDTCMDDRICLHLLNGQPTAPRYKMAGGNLLTFYTAQRLANGARLRNLRATSPGATVQEEMREYQNTVIVQTLGQRTGAHTAELSTENESGCGAADNSPAIIQAIIDSASLDDDPIALKTASFMRIPFSEDLHRKVILEQAKSYASDLKHDGWMGTDLIFMVENPSATFPAPSGKTESFLGQAAIEVSRGDHDVEMAIVNQTNRTLDRDAIGRILWIDEDRIWREAQQHGVDEAEAKSLYQAAMTFNTAALFTLGSGHLMVAKLQSQEQLSAKGKTNL